MAAPSSRSKGVSSSRERSCSGCETSCRLFAARKKLKPWLHRCPIPVVSIRFPLFPASERRTGSQYARGTIVGLTRGTNRGHIARAALEGIAFQVADVLAAMQDDSGVMLKELRVDGGAACNNLLMQIQADFSVCSSRGLLFPRRLCSGRPISPDWRSVIGPIRRRLPSNGLPSASSLPLLTTHSAPTDWPGGHAHSIALDTGKCRERDTLSLRRERVLKEIGVAPGEWDIIVVGGGATGLGAAVDAAARGYRTLLLEATTSPKELPVAAPSLCMAVSVISSKAIFTWCSKPFANAAACCATRRIWHIAVPSSCRPTRFGSFRFMERVSPCTICWPGMSGLDAPAYFRPGGCGRACPRFK